ncbi:Gfo/Idh/MocA family oxidoreductase [Aliifodinibius sp. S!AR15-10]|uniref:Gfo/Idh/MocA family protein n=1 Tax=Aliifodinibius sp. S!AR15-10 TaxID=2950437 RepID=UPI0028644173|nr:Gfo/Idh/MocA family oxidoreductase [Aliifodinibius sp. S!AR15-10]MDR8393439.1 Gfo/Idh/MocA family oxidoreductase [Aliifodinibius sp. S!AR15-10]
MSDDLKTHTIGIIMNGVTGRMGMNQHLLRSIIPIMEQGGVKISADEVIMPDPILVGRNAAKLEKLSEQTGIEKWTTDLDKVLADDDYQIYFDALRTDLRPDNIKKAVAAGKHIYCEKPTALNTPDAVELHEIAEEKGVKHGVVQDKLWLPGLAKLRQLRKQDFFGKILSVKADFGYWVFEGDTIPAQRPSWNYRKEDGGGIILDMFCHWRYVLDNIFGEVQRVSCLGTTHIDKRYDEKGEEYEATADDAAYAIFELEEGIVAQFNSSWTTRVRRDDLVTFQVDGTKGSAVAGLRKAWIQPHSATPKPVWNPDVDSDHDFHEDWILLPDQQEFDNAFKIQWELFLRHVVKDEPFRWNLLEAAKGVQLAEIGYEASEKREWIDVPSLT